MRAFPIHYRYFDSVGVDGVVVVEQKFYPIRETEHCYFVLDELDHRNHMAGLDRSDRAKRVYKNARRSSCYPRKDLALESFMIRKQKQLRHLEQSYQRVQLILANAEKITPENVKEEWGQGMIMIPAKEFVSKFFIFD